MGIKHFIWDVVYSVNFLVHLGIILVFASIFVNEILLLFLTKEKKDV